MHSIYARVSNVSAFATSCFFTLLGLIAVYSAVVQPPSVLPNGRLDVEVDRVMPGKARRVGGRKTFEYAFVNFNATADLTPLFDWNTKQVFVYFAAEYTDAQGQPNEVVIWDRIVRRKEDANLRVQAKNKYQFKDISQSFKNIPSADYVLKYNVMPWVGMLTYGEAARTTQPIPFPKAEETIS